MRTTLDSYKNRAGRLDLDGIDFDDFRLNPLAPDDLSEAEDFLDIDPDQLIAKLCDDLAEEAARADAVASKPAGLAVRRRRGIAELP